MDKKDPNPTTRARIAGLLYLLIIVCGVWSDGVVRSSLIVDGDPAQTASNIAASVGSFRMSFVADTVMVLCDVGLAIVLYTLLRPVHADAALMATAFRLVQASVLAANLLNQHIALMLTTTGHAALDPSVREPLVLLFAQAQSYGYDIGLLFFAFNCFFTGYLVFESGFLPRSVGALVGASGLVYLVGAYLRFLAPSASGLFQLAYALPLLAESAFCLWLLIKGVDEQKWRQLASATYGADGPSPDRSVRSP